MTILRMDVVMGMSTLPFFSKGHGRIVAALSDCSPYDHGSMRPQWELFESVWKDVMEYLRSNFAELGEHQWAYCNLQMNEIREMIESNAAHYGIALSITARHAR